MNNKIYYTIILSLLLGSLSYNLNAQKAERIEELEFRVKTLEEDLKKSIGVIDDLELQIEEAKLYSKSLTDFIAVASKPTGPNYKEEYDAEQKKNKELNSKNRNLIQKQRRLDEEIAMLRRLLSIEEQKVVQLRIKKAELEQKIKNMDSEIDSLKLSNRELTNDKRKLTRKNNKLNRNVDRLQRDSVRKEVKIARQDKKIDGLEEDKVRLIGQKKTLMDLANKQRSEILEIKDKHKVDKLQLLSSYLGVSYNLTALNNPLIKNAPEDLPFNVASNFNLSWFNSLAGVYVSVPYNYCSTNPFAKCDDCDLDTYFSIRDIESTIMTLDIKGIDYENLRYSSSENHFKSYSAGAHAAVFRYVYLSLGVSVLKGCTWDLYEGDLSGIQTVATPNDIIPVKNDDGFYVVNYERLNIIKPTAGVSFVGPFKVLNVNRKTNKQIRSKVLSSYNYRAGFQVEVGYDWLYRDFYSRAGIHVKLWNYDQNILDRTDYRNIASNEVRRGLDIIIDEIDSKNPDDEDINQGIKIIVEAVVGRSIYFNNEADNYAMNDDFINEKAQREKANEYERLACCLTKTFLEADNEELSCDCENGDISLLYTFLPEDDNVKIGGESKRTVLYEKTKKFFESKGLFE